MANKPHIKAVIAIAIAGVGFSAPAIAKPLSYPGGTMVMQENDETGHTLSLDYTVTPKYAVAVYAKKESGGDDFTTFGPQLNTLVKRWNLPDGQGNIFNMTGMGVSHEGSENEFTAWTSLFGRLRNAADFHFI